MAKRGKINTLPAPAPAPALKLEEQYRQAVVRGQGAAFLRDHPKFAANLSAGAKINTLPPSTATPPPPPPPAPAPTQPAADVTQLKLYNQYQQALAKGQGDKFLRQHPQFRQNAGLAKPAKPGAGLDPETAKLAKTEGPRVQAQGVQAGKLQNLGSVQDTFGSSTDTYFDEQTGTWKQKSTLGSDMQQIQDAGVDLTKTGMNKAQAGLEGFNTFGMSGSPEERARIEEEAYKRLTRNVDRDYNQEFEQMEQRMYNRGIPLDQSHPAYKREMDALNEKYGTIKENARQNAVILGKGEAESAFTMGLQGHKQQAQDIGWLQQQGLGFQGGPQVGFNAPQLNQSNFTDVALQNKALGLQEKALNMQNKGGGGQQEQDDGSGLY